MRQNGLRASSFVAVADVDPRVADQLLDLLAFAHVAAYAEPAPGETGVYRDHHVASRPIDRLWVDREATATAREVLERSLPVLQAELETAIAEGTASGSAVPEPRLPDGSAPTDLAPGASTGPAAAASAPGAVTADPSPAGIGGPTAPAGGSGAEGGHGADPDGGPGSGQAGPDAGGAPGELDQASVEALWKDIVAGWDGPTAPGHPLPTWPDGRDGLAPPDAPGPGPLRGPRDAGRHELLRGARPSPGGAGHAGAGPTAAGPPGVASTGRVPHPSTGQARAGSDAGLRGPRDSVAPPEDQHFTPPPPPRHPPLQTVTRIGWAGVVAGPVLLLLVVVFGPALPPWLPLLGVVLLVGGFGLLVSRLHRSGPDDDSDRDDGAVV